MTSDELDSNPVSIFLEHILSSCLVLVVKIMN